MWQYYIRRIGNTSWLGVMGRGHMIACRIYRDDAGAWNAVDAQGAAIRFAQERNL